MRIAVSGLALSFVWLIGCGRDEAKTANKKDSGDASAAISLDDLPGEPIGDRTPVVKPTGLQIVDLLEGSGDPVTEDQPILIHYSAYLADSGQMFDDTHAKNAPHVILLNLPSIVPAWREGIVGMKPGGVRKIIAPPKLAFGQFGRPPLVPGDATVIFDVKVIGLAPAAIPSATPQAAAP